ncbi:tpr-like protein [Fusarium flagelliforme]|uniref:Tpr-like protein n=1 Tax=Fusarium flagelliforme TaxID=2675880 RepID=A0A395ME74_9HYPO|nr:tpr-like protein [Fusarium flagelliforme]
MDSWATFPDPLEPFPTYHEFDLGHESTPHDFISAQQTTDLLEPLHPLNISQELVLPMTQDTWTVSADDSELTAAMGPPPKRRKKKAPTLRAKDWEPYKARILELHDARKLPLAKVKEMIEEEFGFTAELRQYRTRISQWGKDKNIKPAEMAAIVRKRQQRKIVEIDKGEQSFSVRGRDVEPHKIDRWMVRNEVSQASFHPIRNPLSYYL